MHGISAILSGTSDTVFPLTILFMHVSLSKTSPTLTDPDMITETCMSVPRAFTTSSSSYTLQ
jgi:hypothetical protein